MTQQERKDTLRRYMAVPRLSGYEGEMARLFRNDLQVRGGDCRQDRFGNVIAEFPGTDPEAPRVMVFTHMDTIGFVVINIDEQGFLYVDRVGGVPEKPLPALDVLVGMEDGGYVNGVFGMKSYHTLNDAARDKVDHLNTLFIDIGAAGREEVESLGIHVGCPVVYAPRFKELLNDRVAGSYTDAASGLTSLLELAEMLHAAPPSCTVEIVGTVMEEYNARGAMLAQRTAHADMAICLLGPGAGDTPDLKGRNLVRLGGGIGVNLFNFHGKGTLNGNIAHAGMFKALRAASERAGIPIQRQAARGALSDTAYLQLEGEGVPCLDMGTPDRYSHSPMEVLDLKDLARCAPLVYEFLQGVKKGFSLDRF